MIRALLERLTSKMVPRVIYDRDGGSPYLSRYYLIGKPKMADGSSPVDATGQTREGAIFPDGLHLYLHRFHRSDGDNALHSHPWSWAYALILAGGYREERRDELHVNTRIVRPGRIVSLKNDDYHRVDLLENDSWSLFLAGPKASSWSFWDRFTGEVFHWRDFIATVRGPGWDSETARTYQCGELVCQANTAFQARDWFAHKLGVTDRQSVKVRMIDEEKPDAQTAAIDAMSKGRAQVRA